MILVIQETKVCIEVRSALNLIRKRRPQLDAFQCFELQTKGGQTAAASDRPLGLAPYTGKEDKQVLK